MLSHWCDVGIVVLAANAAAQQVAFPLICRWDEGWRYRCSCLGRADRHSLNRRSTHGMRLSVVGGVVVLVRRGRTGGQARRYSWRKEAGEAGGT